MAVLRPSYLLFPATSFFKCGETAMLWVQNGKVLGLVTPALAVSLPSDQLGRIFGGCCTLATTKD
jgi:hypothetical protein